MIFSLNPRTQTKIFSLLWGPIEQQTLWLGAMIPLRVLEERAEISEGASDVASTQVGHPTLGKI